MTRSIDSINRMLAMEIMGFVNQEPVMASLRASEMTYILALLTHNEARTRPFNIGASSKAGKYSL